MDFATMRKIAHRALTLSIALSTASGHALVLDRALDRSPAHTTDTPLTLSIQAVSVEVAQKNRLAGGYGPTASCPSFKGTHSGNSIRFHVKASGGDGKYHHTLFYTLSRNSYDFTEGGETQVQREINGNGDFVITFPDLSGAIPFVPQSVFILARDGSGGSATATTEFLVSRPIILEKSLDSRASSKNCFQRYAPYEGVAGLLSNGSPNPGNITEGVEAIGSPSQGRSFGVYASPFTKLLNLVGLEMSYFRETSKQITETTPVVSEYSINPGDFMQVYVQPTRYVTSYDAIIVDPCGNTEKHESAYQFQGWGFAYHVYPINPSNPKYPPIHAVGAPVVNSCPADLSPNGDGKTAGYEFVRTN